MVIPVQNMLPEGLGYIDLVVGIVDQAYTFHNSVFPLAVRL